MLLDESLTRLDLGPDRLPLIVGLRWSSAKKHLQVVGLHHPMTATRYQRKDMPRHDPPAEHPDQYLIEQMKTQIGLLEQRLSQSTSLVSAIGRIAHAGHDCRQCAAIAAIVDEAAGED